MEEITDLSGVRVVLYTLQDVERVAALIKREFTVDAKRSANKLDLLDADRFGYLSQQYIVKASPLRSSLFEWQDVAELSAEIQVRTVLQHAWAVIDHALLYKSEIDAPKEFRRRLSRIMALFELADQELDNLVKERTLQIQQYKDNLAEKRTQIEINVDSIKAYIQTSDEMRYWNRLILGLSSEFAIDEDFWFDLPEIVQISHFAGLGHIEDLDRVLIGAHDWGEEFVRRYFERDIGKSMSVATDGVLRLLLKAVFAEQIIDKGVQNKFPVGVPDLYGLALEVKRRS